jgi:hypothetical protein
MGMPGNAERHMDRGPTGLRVTKVLLPLLHKEWHGQAETQSAFLLLRSHFIQGFLTIWTYVQYAPSISKPGVQFPAGGNNETSFLRHRYVHSSSGAHPASYPMGIFLSG